MHKVPSTGLAHTTSSVDASFLLPDPDSASDLLCGLEQFHLTYLGASLPHLDERIVLPAPTF